MAFGAEMRIQIPAGEVVMGSIDEDELDELPLPDDIPEMMQHVTEHAMEQLRTFRGDKSYFYELRDAPDREDDGGRNWFIRLRHEVNDELVEEIVGFTGTRNRRTDSAGITSVDTRTVLMQPHLRSMQIGTAVGRARTHFAVDHDGIEIMRANVALGNNESMKNVRRMGFTCMFHFQAMPDPERHKVEFHNPDSRLDLRPHELLLPYWEDDARHDVHDLSWTAPRLRARLTLEAARRHKREGGVELVD